MQKDPGFLIHTTDPVNSEPPVDKLREQFITPQQLYYVRNHGDVPAIDVTTFRLKITGLVDRDLELTMDNIRNDYPMHTVMATLQCAGNRRYQLLEFAPVPGEVPWRDGAIGNAVWGGAKLKDILFAAGVKQEALYVEFMGADDVFRHDENVGFGGSIPVDKAMSGDVLLAYEMNGAPLEPTHGFPLRSLVPGYIGARSVKWLTTITLLNVPSENYFQAHAYQLFAPEIRPETVDWKKGIHLAELAINSIITSPVANENIATNNFIITGIAITGGGRKIARVDISTNGGQSWNSARITHGEHQWAWTFWELPVQLENGEHEIIARAFDASYNAQPAEISQVWNFKGYMHNAWHRIKIHVNANK